MANLDMTWKPLFLGGLLAALALVVACEGNEKQGPQEDSSGPTLGGPGPPACPPLEQGEDSTVSLVVDECRTVEARLAPYVYKYVNVVEGGELRFLDTGGHIDFRAQSVLVERGGRLVAGSEETPFGLQGGSLDLGLYGGDPTFQGTRVPGQQDAGIDCLGGEGAGGLRDGLCYPAAAVGRVCSGENPSDPCTSARLADHTQDNRVFEGYEALTFDDAPFGFKVLAVSYGGVIELHGAKGVGAPTSTVTLDKAQGQCDSPSNDPAAPSDPAGDHNDVRKWAQYSGSSWGRVVGQGHDGLSLTVDRPVGWKKGDRVVVGTNDWNLSHSEVVTLSEDASLSGELKLVGNHQSPLDPGKSIPYGEGGLLEHDHSGEVISVESVANGSRADQVEARAAIGLLSRSIRIRSLGVTADSEFADASECRIPGNSDLAGDPACYFGGHTLIRQGFGAVRISGVEFYQLGQGGRMGHYPVHFHRAKDTGYTTAYVRDSSIWDSMNRFVTVHATHSVEIIRNVGYLSVGHGFFLEEGSEISNLFCHNLGVTTRPSIREYFLAQEAGSRTERFIPPILTRMADWTLPGADSVYPSTFWIMNAYNDFVGNAAVGVGGFGACYWPTSSSVSGGSRGMTWAQSSAYSPEYFTMSPLDYANYNQQGGRQAPFKRFVGNSCQTAAYAFMTERASLTPGQSVITSVPKDAVLGYTTPSLEGDTFGIHPIPNPYYLNTEVMNPAQGGGRIDSFSEEASRVMLPFVESNFNPVKHRVSAEASQCTVSEMDLAATERNAKGCVTTVIDRFATRFNWSNVNFAAIWLRPWNYVVVNSTVSDQLFGGLGFVSGGSPEQVLPRYLAMAVDNLFLGTLSSAPGAERGPEMSEFDCVSGQGQYCWNWLAGGGLYAGGFQAKRLISIYDGPFFSEGNTFGRVSSWTCDPQGADWLSSCGIYGATQQPMATALPLSSDLAGRQMRVVDAAIGWKQPNGFYYPPSFVFSNSHFLPESDWGRITERHNVIDPSWPYFSGSSINSTPSPILLKGSSLSIPPPYPTGWQVQPDITPIDFTTILNDLDGTLNGVRPSSGGTTRSAGVSRNLFYATPGEAAECNSFGTNTVPQDFVSTFVGKLAGDPSTETKTSTAWLGVPGGSPYPVVPIYRQYIDPAFAEDDDECLNFAPVCKEDGSWGCDRGSFMLGTQTGLAPGLTLNQGLYYIDTLTQTQNTLCISPPSAPSDWGLPTFETDQYYAVFNLYATASTSVRYQIYVGETGLEEASEVIDFIRVHPHRTGSREYAVTPWSPIEGGSGPSADWAKRADGTEVRTVVEVTLATGSSAMAPEFAFSVEPTAPLSACQPADLCQVNAQGTGCSLREDFATSDPALIDPLTRVCEKIVSAFNAESAEGVFLSDCPKGGCAGFAFKMGNPVAGDNYEKVGRPLAVPYPAGPPFDRTLIAYSEGGVCGDAPP